MFPTPANDVPQRPAALVGGAAAALAALLAATLEGYLWVRIYNGLTDLIPSEAAADSEAQKAISFYNGFLIAIVIISMLISLSVVAGALLAMRGSNGGRITMWIAGGLAIAWHLCCSGYTLLMQAIIQQAVTGTNAEHPGSADVNIDEHFPMWLVDSVVIAGFAVGLASIVAVVMISLSSVNQYFRAMRQPPAVPPPPGGAVMW